MEVSEPGLESGGDSEPMFFFFKAVPAAYGHSQARGQIGAVHQIGAYTTATATLDLSRICDLCHSPQQRGILNPPSEASD